MAAGRSIVIGKRHDRLKLQGYNCVKLLIAGAAGQLGTAFVSELKARQDIDFVACSRNELDITDADNVRQAITKVKPDFVINTAAYTQVDLAESEADQAYLVNQTGPANLAKACQDLNIPLVHFSTDCVFDGHKKSAWIEDDPTLPLGVYGASKLAGEVAVEEFCNQYLIFRVSWVFSEFGHNFVKTMLNLAATREQLRVVNDQIGKPTCAAEIVRVVLAILPKLDKQWGIYHLAQPDVISWHGFAQAIFKHAAGYPDDTCEENNREGKLVVKEVLPIPTCDYPTPAQRPANSTLDTSKLEQTFGIALTGWHQSLAKTLNALET